jgi:hypothetical protein
MQDIFGEERQQSGGTAQQHGKQIHRHRAQQGLALPQKSRPQPLGQQTQRHNAATVQAIRHMTRHQSQEHHQHLIAGGTG